jgi:hypothetical protein
MIKDIIDALNAKISNLVSNEGLAELIADRDAKTRPMLYKGKGEYKNFNFETGGSYWRVTDTDQNEAEAFGSCGVDIERTYNLKLVAVVLRSKLDCDDEYAEHNVANTIIARLTEKDAALRKLIKARQLTVFVDSYTTDNASIESSEYIGIPLKVKYKYVYLALDVSVNLTIDEKCITLLC